MIKTAEDFVRLRTSEAVEDYHRAAREQASEAVWIDVIQRFPDMRSWVAHNKTVPVSILALLATDEDEHIRCFVAQRRKLTLDLFESLAIDPSSSVRQRLACNAKTPRWILERLIHDDDKFVAEAAARRIS